MNFLQSSIATTIMAWIVLIVVVINHCFIFVKETGHRYHNNGLLIYYGSLMVWFVMIIFFYIYNANNAGTAWSQYNYHHYHIFIILLAILPAIQAVHGSTYLDCTSREPGLDGNAWSVFKAVPYLKRENDHMDDPYWGERLFLHDLPLSIALLLFRFLNRVVINQWWYNL